MDNNQATQPLAQLRDIHLPASPELWPPAPGWWLLATLILFLTGMGLFKALAFQRRKKRQQAIYATLKPIEQKLLNKPNNEVLADLNILLRQLALMHFPQTEIASLSGKNWLAFLDRSGATKQFSQGAGRFLADAPYLPETRPITKKEARALITLVKDWVIKAEIVA